MQAIRNYVSITKITIKNEKLLHFECFYLMLLIFLSIKSIFAIPIILIIT